MAAQDGKFAVSRQNILRQRPRLLYAGLNTTGSGWLGQSQPKENPELMFIGGGSGKIQTNGAEYPFKKGDLILYNRRVPHNEYMDAVAGRELFFLGLGNLRLAGLEPDSLLKDRDFLIVPTESYFDSFSGYLRALLRETESKQPFGDLIADNLLKIILTCVLRITSFDSGLTHRQNEAYLEAKKYFDEHFTEIDSLDNVCKNLYVNKFYLTHVFSQQTGVPPVRYLINKRVELACRRLEASDENVGDVAKACGYSDTGYFCRVFKNVKGLTPLQYRYRYKHFKKTEK